MARSERQTEPRKTTIVSVLVVVIGTLTGLVVGYLLWAITIPIVWQIDVGGSPKNPSIVIWMGTLLIVGGFAGGALARKLCARP